MLNLLVLFFLEAEVCMMGYKKLWDVLRDFLYSYEVCFRQIAHCLGRVQQDEVVSVFPVVQN